MAAKNVEEIRINAKKLEAAGAPIEAIEEYVKTAKQELDAEGRIGEIGLKALAAPITFPARATLGMAETIRTGKPFGPIKTGAEVEKKYPIEETLPILGGIAGSPLGILGGTLGATIGEGGRQIIARARGRETEKTPMEAAGKLATTAALAASGELLGAAVVPTLVAPLTSKIAGRGSYYLPKLLNAPRELTEKAGFPIEIPEVSGQASLTKFGYEIGDRIGENIDESNAVDIIRSRYRVRKGRDITAKELAEQERQSLIVGRAQAGYEKKAGEVFGQYGEKTTSFKSSAKAKKEFEKSYEILNTAANKGRKAIDDLIGNEKALEKKSAIDGIKKIVTKDLGYDLPESEIGRLRAQGIGGEALEELERQSGGALSEPMLRPGGRLTPRQTSETAAAVQPLYNALERLSDENLTVIGLRRIKQTLNAEAPWEKIEAGRVSGKISSLERAYINAAKSIDEAIEKTADKYGAGYMVRQNNKAYSEIYDWLKSPATKILRYENPENILSSVVKKGQGNPTEINELFSHFSEDGKNYLRRGLLEEMSKNPKGFHKELSNYSEETLTALFGRSRKEQLKALSRLSEKVENLEPYLKSEGNKLLKNPKYIREKSVDTIIKEADASKLIDELTKDKELIDATMSVLDEKSKDVLRRALITRSFADPSVKRFINGQYVIDQKGLFNYWNKRSEVIHALFKGHADSVFALRDIAGSSTNIASLANAETAAEFRPFTFFDKLMESISFPGESGRIIQKRFGILGVPEEEIERLKDLAFPRFRKTRTTLRGSGAAAAPTIYRENE